MHYQRVQRKGTTNYVGNWLPPSKARFVDKLCYLEVYNKKKDVIAEAIIDAEDYDRVRKYRLHLAKPDKDKSYIRVVTHSGTRLHSIILGKLDSGFIADHKNRFTLDNRKSNLRAVNHSQNSMNKGKAPGKSSIYKGVHWNAERNKWKAEIKINQVNKYIGRFDDEIEAAEAYNIVAEKLFGEFVCLNTLEG